MTPYRVLAWAGKMAWALTCAVFGGLLIAWLREKTAAILASLEELLQGHRG